MFLFHNATPGRYIKSHECFSTYNIVYAKYIQLNITFDPIHRYSYEFDSQNREKNQSWIVKVNLILCIMIKWASGYGRIRVFNF